MKKAYKKLFKSMQAIKESSQLEHSLQKAPQESEITNLGSEEV